MTLKFCFLAIFMALWQTLCCRRRDLAAREFKLANVLGLSRSCKKKELLRRARKEIEVGCRVTGCMPSPLL